MRTTYWTESRAWVGSGMLPFGSYAGYAMTVGCIVNIKRPRRKVA